MNTKLATLIGVMILMSYSVSANVITTEDVDFDLGGVIFTIKANETFDNALLKPNGESALILTMNGSSIRFTSASAKTLSNLSYTYYADRYEYTANGSADPLNVTAETRLVNIIYRFHVDQLIISTNQSASNYQVSFTFNDWATLQHDFIIDLQRYNITGIVTNKINQTLQFANVSTGQVYNVTSWNGNYTLTDIPAGNYTLLSKLYAYANKRINVTINQSDITQNITMNALNGGAIPVGDTTGVYLLGLVGGAAVFWMIYSGRKKDEDEE